MPNYLLCDQFHLRTSVLVYTLRLAVTSKGTSFKSKRYVSPVLCVGLFRMQSYVEYWASQEPGKVSYTLHES